VYINTLKSLIFLEPLRGGSLGVIVSKKRLDLMVSMDLLTLLRNINPSLLLKSII